MPLITPKKPKKFTLCNMLTCPLPEGEEFLRVKCNRQCGLCMMIQYAKENPGEKPYVEDGPIGRDKSRGK